MYIKNWPLLISDFLKLKDVAAANLQKDWLKN